MSETKNININLFPTTIKYVINFLSLDEINKIIEISRSLPFKNHDTFIGDGKSSYYKRDNFLENTIFDKKINEALNDYTEILGMGKVKMSESWVNIQKPNSELLQHCHSPSPISGALYLKTDAKSSKLCFHNPNPYIRFYQARKSNECNFEFFSFKVNTGDLVLFPGWLNHSSNRELNLSEERIVLSLNTIFV